MIARSTLVWLGERFLDFRELILHFRAPLDMIKTLISEPKRSATDITNAPHSA